MDNKKTDQYYIDKIITDLTFIRTHTESLSKLKLEEDEILVDSIMFRLIQIRKFLVQFLHFILKINIIETYKI